MIAKMAKQVADALDRAPPKRSAPPVLQETGSRKSVSTSEVVGDQAAESASAQLADAARRVTPKTEPPTRVVDPLYRGDHLTLTDALNAANAGDRIVVRQGFYQEGVVINKTGRDHR
jgi:hypothetical protein